jgi:hypothetical protein
MKTKTTSMTKAKSHIATVVKPLDDWELTAVAGGTNYPKPIEIIDFSFGVSMPVTVG